jgi:hypothetical protein
MDWLGRRPPWVFPKGRDGSVGEVADFFLQPGPEDSRFALQFNRLRDPEEKAVDRTRKFANFRLPEVCFGRMLIL